MKQKYLKVIMALLTVHIFTVHIRLLYYLNPEIAEKSAFSFLQINESMVLAFFVSLAYSIATFFAVTMVRKRYAILIFGGFDAVSLVLYYDAEIPLIASVVYYALYTFALFGTLTFQDKTAVLEKEIVQLKRRGISQKKIAAELNLSESKVSRTIKRTLEADQSTKRKAS